VSTGRPDRGERVKQMGEAGSGTGTGERSAPDSRLHVTRRQSDEVRAFAAENNRSIVGTLEQAVKLGLDALRAGTPPSREESP
jgi:hypothetical protein